MEDAIYNEDDNICETPCEKGYYFVEPAECFLCSQKFEFCETCSPLGSKCTKCEFGYILSDTWEECNELVCEEG